MPKLAAFPKAYLDDLCLADRTMTLRQWIDLASKLDIDGLELYSGIRDLSDPKRWSEARLAIEDAGLAMPMMCCSPDFTHPDKAFRQKQIDLEKGWIDMTAALGGQFCRVLSGQRRPEVSREQGIGYASESIEACIPHAAERGITLIL
jgi:sugar phosphate isomerase/epimerase